MLKKLSLMLFAVAVLAGCTNKNKDPFAGYPKNVQVTYKVSSTVANGVSDIAYTNDTGGETELLGVKLPFSKTIEKKVEYAEVLELAVSSNSINSVTVEIEVNGKVAVSKRFDGASNLFGYI